MFLFLFTNFNAISLSELNPLYTNRSFLLKSLYSFDVILYSSISTPSGYIEFTTPEDESLCSLSITGYTSSESGYDWGGAYIGTAVY